jgi:DUF4097 and DUF4098 domain-containing protein YvlB
MADYTFHTPEPVQLEVKVPAGDIEVETIDGDESTVVLEGPDKLLEQTRVELVGNRLKIEHETRGPFGLTIQVGDWHFGRGGMRVRARVPHASRAELKTTSADMNLLGRFSALQVNSVSGDLGVTGEIDGDAEIKTVSGDVRLGPVGGSLTVQGVSSDVNAESVGADATVKSVSGDVRIAAAREGHVTVQSISGDIEIGVSAGTNLDVDAGSVSGDLASEVPLGSDADMLGGGPTLVVRGKTVSGDFKVFRAA